MAKEPKEEVKTEKEAAPAKEDKPKEKKPQKEKAKGDEKKGKGEKGKETAPAEPEEPAPKKSRLQIVYESQIVPALKEEFKYQSPMQIPRLKKVVLNMGLGEAVANPKIIDGAVEEMTAISGQHPVVRRSRKAIANFKLRAGMPIGVSVTLRGIRMYEFLDRLVNIALPRVRDFRGVSPKAFDGKGNYTLGVQEQIIFPEINYDKIDKIKGLNITIVTSARNDDEARSLLTHLGMPFRKR